MSKQKQKLVIVGAGLSGLYLANALEEHYDITILEARNRLGGRIFSIEGHDMGPSWVWSHHTQILALLKSLDIEIFPQYSKGYALFDTKDMVQRFVPQSMQDSFCIEKTLAFLIEKLQKRLKSTNIILNTNVKSIQNKEEFLELKSLNETFKADKVILALPPRLCAKIDFTPKLEAHKLQKLLNTHTWMGNSAKCVIEFEAAFWREKGLSGFVFSNQGPLSEIHDACTKEKPALFGFVSSQASRDALVENIKIQLCRIFEIEESQIGNIYFLDWKEEEFTATKDDVKPLIDHPQYGISISHMNEKILFSSTEFSFDEGGYLEGALLRAEEISKELLKF